MGTELRKNGTCDWVRPDAKTQVTVEYKYDEHGVPIPQRVHTVVISCQHSEDVTQEQISTDLMEHVVKQVIPEKYLDESTVYHLNPSGRFVIGGPHGDAGLTGRKIIIDSYGTVAKEGMTDADLTKIVEKNFDLRPGGTIRDLDLRRPIFRKTAAYGHFGREDPDFTWEKPKKLEF